MNDQIDTLLNLSLRWSNNGEKIHKHERHEVEKRIWIIIRKRWAHFEYNLISLGQLKLVFMIIILKSFLRQIVWHVLVLSSAHRVCCHGGSANKDKSTC